MLFASFRSELDTAPLIDWALRAGKVVCLPRVLGPRAWRPSASPTRPPTSSPAPGASPSRARACPRSPPEAIDVVVVPGVGFDRDGGRCGYGGGFYDNYLPRTRPGTPRVALAFEVAAGADDLPARRTTCR